MTAKQFLALSLNDLASVSGMDKTRWSKYFNGKTITENVLNQIAPKLQMEPHQLLQAINIKRLQNYATCAKVKSIA